MSFPFLAFLTAIFAMIATIYTQYRQHTKRREFIESYRWPPGLIAKLSAHHPHLTQREQEQVARGLKQFFRAYLEGGLRPVAMPSQVADDLWHEMILYTRAYAEFCDKAFGRFLHHTPAAVLSPELKTGNVGLRRVWWHCCKLEGIDAKSPQRLPLLFALDSELKIANGYHYTPDCRQLSGANATSASYCGGDFASISIDGTTDGLGDGDGGSGDGGDGGGGCGGD